MASETIPPPHHQDADENQVEEATKTVDQEISLPSTEDIKTDQGKLPKTLHQSSGSVEDKVEDRRFDSLPAQEAEKVYHTPDSHAPEVADPNTTSFAHSNVEDLIDKQQEAQSSVSAPPQSSSPHAEDKLAEHLEVSLVQERGPEEGKSSQVPGSEAEIFQSTVNEHQVQKASQVAEMVKETDEEGKTTASQVEERLLEELKKNQDLEPAKQPQEQIGVVEDIEKKEDLESEEKPSEQTNVLEELGNKQASGVEGKNQEQTGYLHGDTEKEPTSIIEDVSQGKTGFLDTQAEKQLTSEVEETQQAKVGVLEGEIGKKLELEVEEKSQEQTGVVEELDQKLTSDEETKTQHASVLDEVGKELEIPESVEPAKVVGQLADKVEEVSESLKEEHTVCVDEPAVSGNSVADVCLNENTPSDAKEGADDTNNEQSRTDVAEGLAKEVEVGKTEETKNILDEKASKSETLNSVEASDSLSHVEASKVPFGGEKTSVDVGVTDEEEKEIEVKVKELGGESKKLEPSYTEQSVEDKLGNVVEHVEETLKSDTANLEPSKDVNELNTEGIDPKLESRAKPTQKQSNNILSKVKHSIGKVKKAITGRSPSSKTISVDAKGDVNVK